MSHEVRMREVVIVAWEAAKRDAEERGHLVLTAPAAAGMILARNHGSVATAIPDAREDEIRFGWWRNARLLLETVMREEEAATLIARGRVRGAEVGAKAVRGRR
jgi:hypothetical protein